MLFAIVCHPTSHGNVLISRKVVQKSVLFILLALSYGSVYCVALLVSLTKLKYLCLLISIKLLIYHGLNLAGSFPNFNI